MLQAREYLQAMWAAALDPSLDTTGHYRDAPLILHIADLAVAKDKLALASFVQAKFGVDGELSLHMFGAGGATLCETPTLRGAEIYPTLSTSYRSRCGYSIPQCSLDVWHLSKRYSQDRRTP